MFRSMNFSWVKLMAICVVYESSQTSRQYLRFSKNKKAIFQLSKFPNINLIVNTFECVIFVWIWSYEGITDGILRLQVDAGDEFDEFLKVH